MDIKYPNEKLLGLKFNGYLWNSASEVAYLNWPSGDHFNR